MCRNAKRSLGWDICHSASFPNGDFTKYGQPGPHPDPTWGVGIAQFQQSDLPFWDTTISKFDHENPWSRSCVWSKVKVTFALQNSKVKVMVKVKPIGHIWGLEFNRYICFSFRGNRTTFVWAIGNSIFDFENLRSGSRPRSNLLAPFKALDFHRFVCFSFRGNRTIIWLWYSKFYIWPW